MLELGDLIGAGYTCAYFKIKGRNRIGALIVYNCPFLYSKKSFLKSELKKMRILRKLGFSVPKAMYIKKFNIKEDLETNINKRNDIFCSYKKTLINSLKENKHLAIITEFVESDIESIKEVELAELIKDEKMKIRSLGIKINDSTTRSNMLWSKKRKKYYFIDFVGWQIPLRLELKYWYL